ncbi:MAG: transposase domain-containing protein [Pedosphaera sp.]|nr:transposase domain-containing protein [Pedosphaera sp.]
MLGFLTYPHSLLITARRYGLDPVAGLTDVLRRIPQAMNHTVAELLPWNWKPAKA